MALRTPKYKPLILDDVERKALNRVYFLWLMGIAIGTLNITGKSVVFFGITYAYEDIKLLQGLIFLGAILFFVSSTVNGIIFGPTGHWHLTSLHRHYIYGAANIMRKGQPSLKRPGYEIRLYKRIARARITIFGLIALVYLLLPLAHIVIFHWATLTRTVSLFL